MSKVTAKPTQTKPKTTSAQEKQALEDNQNQQRAIDTAIEATENALPALKNVLDPVKQKIDHQFSVERAAIEAQFKGDIQTPKKPQSKPSKADKPQKAASKPLPKSSNPFINQIAQGAVDAQKKFGVPASVTMAQAILESGWGKSSLASKDHNLFGIKGQGPAGSVTVPTREYENGHYVTIDAAFRKYHNDAESIADHAKLLATSSYYKKAMSDRGSPDKFADDLTGVYATDPHYGAQLKQIMKEYDLYKYNDPKLAGGGAKPSKPSTGAKPSGTTKPSASKPKSGSSAKSGGTYVVRSGDSLSLIASRQGVSLAALERANPQIKNFNVIYPGDRINLPGGSSRGTRARPPSKASGPSRSSGGTSAPSNGKDASKVARNFLGESEYQLQPSHKLDMDTWVPKTEDCANFVSGCLEKAGLISHGQRSDGVVQLAANLRHAGWRDVSLKSAKPGDVVCFDGPGGNYQHVEIFDHWQGNTPVFIGSNNVMSDGTQKISYDVGGKWAYRFHILAPPN